MPLEIDARLREEFDGFRGVHVVAEREENEVSALVYQVLRAGRIWIVWKCPMGRPKSKGAKEEMAGWSLHRS